MPLKNTIAFERRIDLASLFCMIGRHGPAVVMAVLGMACLVAGFIIYRTVRERWRRRAAEPDDRDSHAGHRGAALGLWEEEEPSAGDVRTSTGSTDTSEDSASDDQEDRYLSHRHPKVRHRQAAAKTQPYKDTSVAEKAFVWDLNSHRPMGKYTEEAYQSLESDFTSKTKDVTEEVCGTKEPEVNNAVRCEEEEKVFEAGECEDVSEEKCRQVEQPVEFTFSNPVCFSQTPNFIIQEKENNTLEAKSQEPNLEDINISAPHFENETNEIDQCQNAEQTVPYDKCDSNNVSHLTDEKQEPSNLLQEVPNDNSAINNVNIETLSIADRIDFHFNCQNQSEPPRLDEEIDQNGLCPQKQKQNAETSTELKIPCTAALVDPSNQSFEQFELKDNSMSSPSLESGISSMAVSPDVEVLSEDISSIAQDQTDKIVDQKNDISGNGFTVSCPGENVLIVQNAELELNEAEAETVDHQKVDEKMDIKPSAIKQDTFIQCEEIAQPNQTADQGKTVCCPVECTLIVQNADLELNKAEAETVDHLKVDEKMDIKPSTIKQDTFIQEITQPNQTADQGKTVCCPVECILIVQNAELELNKAETEAVEQCEEAALPNQAADQGSSLSNLKDNIEEELPNIPQDEVNSSIAEVGQSSNVASSPEDCLLLPAPPTEPTAILKGRETSSADISTISDTTEETEEQQVEDKEYEKTPNLDIETAPEIDVSGQKNTIGNDREQLVTEVHITEDANTKKDQQTTIKAEIQEQNPSLQNLHEVEDKQCEKTPNLDIEIVCPTSLCHPTEPEIDVSGQKNTIGNDSEQLVTEVHITDDANTEKDQQTTIKAEIQEQNPSLQNLHEVDLLQLKDSHDNLVSESLEELTKKLEVTEEKQGGNEESIVHIKEEILTVTSCPDLVKVESEDQTLSAIEKEIVDNTLPLDTKSNETYLDTNIDISKKAETGDLNVCQVVTTDTFEASDLEGSSCLTIGVFDSPSTFPDLAVTAEETIAQTQAQNSANACPDLVKVENEKENLSGIETEVVETEMEPKEREHGLDTNNTEVGNQNGCQVITLEGSSVQVPSQIENVSSSQTVKAFDNSRTQDMVVTEGIDAQISAEMASDTSLEPCDMKNEVTEEKCLSDFETEIVDIKDSHVSILNECEIVSKEHETPLYSNNNIPAKTEAGNQNGCKKVIDDTFDVSAVGSSWSESDPSCQTNDSGVSSDMIASSENTYSFLEQTIEYQHDEIEVSDKFPVRAEECTSNSAIPTAEPEPEPDVSSNQELQKDHAKISNMEFDIPSSAAPVDPSNLSLEQSELKDIGMSSSDLESEISSITASPDVEVSEKIRAVVVGCVQPKCDHVVVSHDSAEFRFGEEYLHSLCTHNVVVTNEEVETILTESSPVMLSPPEDISNESLVTNEDSFGSEIENGYQKAMEELMTQAADNINIVSEVKKQINVNKKEKVCAVNQGEAEKLKVEIEKTEISIMEATMEHNEWITDGNYQVLPWMNAPLFVKNNSKEPEIPQVVENKPEENSENAKKVLAVQPMPQNVNVTFRVHYLTLSPYQTVAVTGDQQELGSWKSVIPLQKAKDGYWSCVVSLPAESHVEWKFVVLDKGEVCRWEECGNRLLYTGYGDDLLVHKWWGSL